MMAAEPIRPLAGTVPGLRLTLPFGVQYEVWPEHGFVATVFRDGKACIGRREDTAENRAQAAEQGYPGTAEGVWASLVEHELLHSTLSAYLFGSLSPTLRHEAGGEHASLAVRQFEEGIVLAFQRYRTTGEVGLPLARYTERELRSIRLEHARRLPQIPPRPAAG